MFDIFSQNLYILPSWFFLPEMYASFLPETNGVTLPETLSEAANFGRDQKYFSWIRSQTDSKHEPESQTIAADDPEEQMPLKL